MSFVAKYCYHGINLDYTVHVTISFLLLVDLVDKVTNTNFPSY